MNINAFDVVFRNNRALLITQALPVRACTFNYNQWNDQFLTKQTKFVTTG